MGSAARCCVGTATSTLIMAHRPLRHRALVPPCEAGPTGRSPWTPQLAVAAGHGIAGCDFLLLHTTVPCTW